MDQLHDLRHSEDRSLFWCFGAKYAVTPQLDVTGAFYYLSHTDYNTTACAGALSNTTLSYQTGINSLSHAQAAAPAPARKTSTSALIDYRPVKRVDLYAGLMVSNVYGGLANGFPATQDISPTAGIRIKF